MDKRASLPFVLALLVGLAGCASGDSPAADGPGPESSAKASASGTAEPGMTKQPGGPEICAEKSNGQTCAFGQAAAFTVTAGSGPTLPIEITVASPIPFTPADELDAEDATQADNVTFLVTLKNLSSTEWENVTIFAEAVSAGVPGSEIGPGSFAGVDVPPNGSAQVQEEWSVADADDVSLTLDLEGLAGHSITFTR